VLAATKARAAEMQWEVDDDEYDDSFDGLQAAGKKEGAYD